MCFLDKQSVSVPTLSVRAVPELGGDPGPSAVTVSLDECEELLFLGVRPEDLRNARTDSSRHSSQTPAFCQELLGVRF
jgi:hypothetical protein